ncbi:hypothetical protein C4D60_Mb08t28400 [Musa balbisiana]|uniref:Uncharacterized protein n=1 Tax=Musa balbisiana TaxID=52838 RepID=A0A4S8K746_MUSBA|nr:hypothetical protein C4D60_Mb08t28400 [Musa balbisiana]
MEDREAEVPPFKFGIMAEEICRSGFPTATDFGSLEEMIIRTRFLCPEPHPEDIIRFPGFVCSCSESKEPEIDKRLGLTRRKSDVATRQSLT